jgi:peptidoglycan/LPS O-acetylase OafA/YrhL
MSTAASAPRQIRLGVVDLLRGLAIFFVLMNHVNMQLIFAHVPYTRGLPHQLVSSLVWNGQMGVQIFFAISGFLITSTTLRRWGSLATVNVREFYQMRFARIAPLLLLLLAVLSALHLAHVKHFVISQETGGLGRALLAALTFHSNWLEAHRGYLPGNWDILWSLSIEEMFYLFFPLLCRLLRRERLLVALLSVFVILGPFARSVAFNHNPVWREYSYLGGMDAIALGCLTALFVAHSRLSRRMLWTLSGTGAAILVFCLCFSIQLGKWGLERTGLSMSLLAAGACLVIAATSQAGWNPPRLFLPLQLLGQRSYEVYLTHMFVVIGVFQVFLATSKPVGLVPVVFGMVILLSAILGELVGRFYSEPLNRRLRRQWRDPA